MSKKITIVDGYTLSTTPPDQQPPAGEPTWNALAAMGDLTYYPRSTPEELIERCQGAAIALTNKAVFDAKVIGQLPDLRYIGVTATGTNIVDLEAAKSAGITVTNAPGYGAPSVAQHVFALLLTLTNRTGEHNDAVQDGDWITCPDFTFTRGPMVELAGKTLGIVGLGDIGSAVARIGHSFGMNLAVHSRTKKDIGLPVRWLEVDELFQVSDVVTLHCPLTPQTDKLVNAQRLRAMKPTAFLINTGRGPLVDEAALAKTLAEGEIAGAGLDVLGVEPPTADNPMFGAPRCVITPHNAWMSQESRSRLMDITAENLRAFLAGQPMNVVNP